MFKMKNTWKRLIVSAMSCMCGIVSKKYVVARL